MAQGRFIVEAAHQSRSCIAGEKILDFIGITQLGNFRHESINLVLQAEKDLGEGPLRPRCQSMQPRPPVRMSVVGPKRCNEIYLIQYPETCPAKITCYWPFKSSGELAGRCHPPEAEVEVEYSLNSKTTDCMILPLSLLVAEIWGNKRERKQKKRHESKIREDSGS